MHNPALTTLLADARIEDLRRAGGTSIESHRSREARSTRAAVRWRMLSRARVRRLVFAAPSRAN
jgi:hypothetical protein